MEFHILSNSRQVPDSGRARAYLRMDGWDDWFKFTTLYYLSVFDDDGQRHDLGGVKIGQFGMAEGQARADLPETFDALDDRFFSLGQDDSYYDDLNKLGAAIRENVLCSLRDVAADLELFSRALQEDVTETSLLRSVSPNMVRGQFHRMTQGGARLSAFTFDCFFGKDTSSPNDTQTLSFAVEPESHPPTNVHVLVGRNGVGKTTMLNKIARSFAERSAASLTTLRGLTSQGQAPFFANLISISFSAFDEFSPTETLHSIAREGQFSYIGLKKQTNSNGKNTLISSTPNMLSDDFVKSLRSIRGNAAKLTRWRKALETLETDELFRSAEAYSIIEMCDWDDGAEEYDVEARAVFDHLSSGHKIVLLTITRLVEKLEERSLVLFDEPEAHLHPPLLSAFIRALSELLIDRNGVAIVATHSPVVLQEVPQSCVWKLERSGEELHAYRPDIETFGESVGILTSDVFGLEVTYSGFHKMLRDIFDESGNYEEAIERVNGKLGSEGKAILRALFAIRTSHA